jgi:hypothetical protein
VYGLKLLGFVSPTTVTAKLFELESFTNVVLAPGINNVVFLKYVSLATAMVQLMVLVAERLVAVAVAVNNVLELAATLGVPDMVLPDSDTPVGNELALYVTAEPAALVAVNPMLAITALTVGVYVVPAAGLVQDTTSVLMVKLKLLLLSCSCASVARTVNEYVVLPLSTGAVPEIVPLALNTAPVGNAPENKLYVTGASPEAATLLAKVCVS